MLLMTFLLSLGAVAQRTSVTKGFVLLNWMLIVDAFAVLIVGSLFWFITLQERNHYFGVFKAVSNNTRVTVAFTPTFKIECPSVQHLVITRKKRSRKKVGIMKHVDRNIGGMEKRTIIPIKAPNEG